jgi:UDP-N-acetylglucosamine acyltransferase
LREEPYPYMRIHPTAIVSPKAELAEDVIVEAFCVIGPGVVIGSGTALGPHVVIERDVTIGERNRIYPFVTVGCAPQDLTYEDEETRVVLGDDNTIREGVTIHRGTRRGEGVTRVGNSTFLMAYAHVAHDCQLGDHVIMANLATLGGHVQIAAHAVVGGLVAVHQFVRVGEYAFIGGKAAIRMDIPPYMLATGAEAAKLYGPNIIGLKRHGFSTEVIQALKKSYRILFRSGLTMKEALGKAREEAQPFPEVEKLLTFVAETSKRGITR